MRIPRKILYNGLQLEGIYQTSDYALNYSLWETWISFYLPLIKIKLKSFFKVFQKFQNVDVEITIYFTLSYCLDWELFRLRTYLKSSKINHDSCKAIKYSFGAERIFWKTMSSDIIHNLMSRTVFLNVWRTPVGRCKYLEDI